MTRGIFLLRRPSLWAVLALSFSAEPASANVGAALGVGIIGTLILISVVSLISIIGLFAVPIRLALHRRFQANAAEKRPAAPLRSKRPESAA